MASGLTSASTDAQVRAAYDDNANYAEVGSVTAAKDFVTACRILIRRESSSMTKGANALSFRIDLLREELNAAQKWLEARDVDERPAGTKRTKVDFRCFRG